MKKIFLLTVIPFIFLFAQEDSNASKQMWDAYEIQNEYQIRHYKSLGFDAEKALALKKLAPDIGVELAIKLLKYFDAQQAYEVYNGLPLLDKKHAPRTDIADYEAIIRLSEKFLSLKDTTEWYMNIEPKGQYDEQAMIDYYRHGFNYYDARSYIAYLIPVEKALMIEAKAKKECNKDWNGLRGGLLNMSSNAYDLKNRCIKISNAEQKILLDKNTGVYKYENAWIKITDKTASAKKVFTGIVKFGDPVKFTEPNGYTTMIPSATSIVTYSLH